MKKILKWSVSVLGILIVLAVAYFFFLNHQLSQISVGVPIVQSDSDNPALVVVDIQEATTGKVSITEPLIQQSETLIPIVNKLAQSAEANGIPVIYIVSEMDNWFLNLLNSTYKKGTLGTKPDSRMILVSDYIIHKHMNDSFSAPELDALLTKNKINHLYFAGLDAAYCLKSTIQAAQNRNYNVTVIDDAVISESPDLRGKAFEHFESNGVSLISSSEF